MYAQYLKVQPTKNKGKGIFTTAKIPANTPIMEITGPLLTAKDITLETDPASYLQIGPDTYLGLSGAVDDYINHSCDPNCKLQIVGNRAILYSLYVIPVGAEITFDYSTSSTDTLESWKMECKCGSYKCRKIISGYEYLDPAIQETYKKKDMFPLYITNPTLIQKRW